MRADPRPTSRCDSLRQAPSCATPTPAATSRTCCPSWPNCAASARCCPRKPCDALGGKDKVEAYSKAAIVGINGELEHGAVWHEAGGWAMRQVLGDPKAMVPAAKCVAVPGYRLIVPLHYIHASYVRSHYNSFEVGIQDAPRPDEILFALVMADGGRIHSRLGGLRKDQVSAHDGQR